MAIALGGTGVWDAGFRFAATGPAVEAAAAAEQLGYTALWLPDVGGDDLFDRLAALLAATSRITVATGILNLWMHDPSVVAAQYAKLIAEYGDRLLLGIGVSHAPVVEDSGVGQYRRPVAKMQAFLDDLDAASPPVPLDRRVLAALGPRMLGVARDRAAGAHPYLVTPEHTHAARAALGADKILAPEVTVVLESDPTVAREIARAGLALYFGLPNYTNNWRRYGFTDDDVAAPGNDRLVDALVAWGDEKAIAARLQMHRDAGADHLAVQVWHHLDVKVPRGDESSTTAFPIEQWRRLAPSLIG